MKKFKFKQFWNKLKSPVSNVEQNQSKAVEKEK
jgi:hypothetical protein